MPTAATTLDAEVVREAARGRWRSVIYPALNINVGNGKHGTCPICGGKDRFRCDDKDGSGSWYCNQCDPQAGDGFALVMNVRGCDFLEALRVVTNVVGLNPSSQPNKMNGHASGPKKIVAIYDYVDEAGALQYQTVRYEPKDFRQRRPDGTGESIWNLDGVHRVLQHLPAIHQNPDALIIHHEGERCTEASINAQLPGVHTTTVGGSDAARLTDFSPIQGRHLVVCPDNDAAGERYLADVVAMATAAGAASVKVLRLPNLPTKGDVVDWLKAGGTPEQFAQLLEQAEPIEADQDSEPAPSGVFAPVSLAQLLDEPEPLEPEWTLEDILAAGILAAIVSKPKVGKTTLMYELAVAVAYGRVFLGRATKHGNVLILAVEEHRRDVKRRLRNLGADQLAAIHVHAGPLDDSPDTLHALASFIRQHNITLVIFDTLNAFWSVSDENNAGEVTRAIKPILQLARGTGATVLLIHHSRKAEGDFGDEIRGSGALFSLLDTALILKRHTVDIQRRLTIISRYPESPPELLLELREHGYVSLGDPAKNDKAAKLTKLADALTDSPVKVEDLAVKAGVAVKPTYALLELLVEQGKSVRGGTGKRGDPFLYSRFVSVATPKTGGLEATNKPSTPLVQGPGVDPGFVASGVQPLEGEKQRNETNEGLPGQDSFLPTPVPPGSNESVPGEEVVDL